MIDRLGNTDKIVHRNSFCCFLCGSEGKILYENLFDRLFGAFGTWNYIKCTNYECGLIWIDPMPMANEIEKLYPNYYTHESTKESLHDESGQKYVWLSAWRIYRMLLRLMLTHKERLKRKYMYLDYLSPGKLLDVGCGTGQFLHVMKKKGWEVYGQDINYKSAKNALRTYGLRVDIGRLEDLLYPENKFDAITLSHVIEHAYNPVMLLRECRRILKPGGLLIIVTPNSESFGHTYFKSNYRGLEPPRHLFLYNQKNLQDVVKKAGFSNNYRTWTDSLDITYYIAYSSLELKTAGGHQMDSTPKNISAIFAMLFHIISRVILIFNKHTGEECILIAINKY